MGLLDVVVLNLAIEYAPSVISESFTLSLLTAALLKIALELVILLKSAIVTRLRAADRRRAKLAVAVSLWVVAAGSKLVVLELVDLVFGDAVSLGGFISVTLLVSPCSWHGPRYGASSTAPRLRPEHSPPHPAEPTRTVKMLVRCVRDRA